MKIRTGFVSNSSSSSFILAYNKIEFEDINENDLNLIYIHVLVEEDPYGESGEGDDLIHVNKEIYDYLKDNPDKLKNFNTFLKVYAQISEDESMVVGDLPKNAVLRCVVLDQNAPYNFKGFLEYVEAFKNKE